MAAASVLLQSLAIVMIAAAATTLVFHRLRQPLVLGYLAAGFLIGPYTPLLAPVADAAVVQSLRDLGLIVLMFALGLEFNLRKAKRVGGVALVAGSLEIALMIGVGFLVGRALGWDPLQSLFLGSILAISSTTIIVAILLEQGKMDEEFAHLIFGILIVEDLAAVMLIALLGGIAGAGPLTFVSVAILGAKIGFFIAAALLLGLLVVPWLIDHVSRLALEEILVVTVLGLAFGMALLSGLLGFSVALGAFIVGAVISEARSVAHVERRIAPLRDAFAAVFFVAVGMLIDPAILRDHLWTIVAITVASIVGKIASVSFAAFVAGYPPRSALQAGVGLAMIGEFSFLIAGIAEPLFPELLPMAVVVSAATTLVTPPLIRQSPRLADAAGRLLPQPIANYLHMYRGWIARLAIETRSRVALPRAQVLRFAAYATVVAAALVAASLLDDVAVAYLGPDLLIANGVLVAVWVAAGLVAAPAAAAALTNLRDVIWALAEVALPTRLRERDEAEAVARVLRSTFWLFATVAVAVAGLLFASPFLPPFPVLLVTLGLVIVASVVLYDATARLHARLDAAVAAVVDSGRAEPSSRDEMLSFIRSEYPWNVTVEHVALASDTTGAGRTLRDLGLRQATGASVVAIDRGGERVVNPGPDTLLRAGDVLTILGEGGQVEAARTLLSAPVARFGGEALGLETVPVLPESGVVGKSLGESGIREVTGAQIVGLRRAGEEPVTNPPASTRIAPGDHLLVLGTADQIRRARLLLGGGRPSGAPAPGGAA